MQLERIPVEKGRPFPPVRYSYLTEKMATVTAMIRAVVTITNTVTVITMTTNTAVRGGLQMKSKPFPVARTRILVMFGA